MPDHPQDRLFEEAITEIIRVGNVLRASAMDPRSLTEVSVVGPLDAGEELLRRTALAKLDYVLRKQGHTGDRKSPAAPARLDVPLYGPGGRMRQIR